jgi:hypothetical protein
MSLESPPPQCPLSAPSFYEWNRECSVWFNICLSVFHKTFDTTETTYHTFTPSDNNF